MPEIQFEIEAPSEPGHVATKKYVDDKPGGITIPATAYASNAEAVAALGVGKLYKSQSLSVNGSPYILITV
jgi:hypothetical protein